jgi:peptidyl-prolyl cis-trans isomerase C
MLFSSVLRGAAALALAFPLLTQAAEPVLAQAADKFKVNTGDVQGDALRIPPEARKTTLAKPEAVQQLANNLVIRRALAAEAEAAGLADDPAVQGALRIARDRVLSDALFARMDAANKPSRQILEAIASTNYKADPKRFDLPVETGTSHILIKKDAPDARAKISDVLTQLKAGANFADLAKAHSQDTSAAQGGLVGYFPDGQLAPEYEVAAKALQKPGDLSGIVETQFGFHIIKLEGRRPAGIRSFDEVKEFLVREAEAKILNDKRLEHVGRIQGTVVFDKAALEAFAASNK